MVTAHGQYPSLYPPSFHHHSTDCLRMVRTFATRFVSFLCDPENTRWIFVEDIPNSRHCCPSSYSHPSYLPVEAENKNRSDVTLHAALIHEKSSLAPGDSFLLNIELHNPNHNTIKCLSINLVQHRTIAMVKGVVSRSFLSWIWLIYENSPVKITTKHWNWQFLMTIASSLRFITCHRRFHESRLP